MVENKVRIYIQLLGILFIGMISCKDQTKRISYDDKGNETRESIELKKDTTLIKIADLPIHIDSTKYLIHVRGEISNYSNSRSGYFSSSKSSGAGFNVSNYRNSEITGNIHNLKFENIETGQTNVLTEEVLRIQSFKFLREIYKKTGEEIIIYNVLDKDTNADRQLTYQDLTSLYISNSAGGKFTKISKEYYEVLDWEVIPINNRLYFRSITDSNKNGNFDKEDAISYQFIDLSSKSWEVKDYNPF